jgi:hypothetical protein
MKRSFTILTLTLILVGLAWPLQAAEPDTETYIWQTPRVSNIDIEATAELRERLSDEVRRVIEADAVLAPLCLSYGDIPGQALWIYTERGRIVTTLASAYPHVSEELQTGIREYVRKMLREKREQPWQPGLKAHDEGLRRELHGKLYPARNFFYPDINEWPVLHVFYGLWLYADRTGDWEPIRENWKKIVQAYTHYARQPELVLYGQLSGHIGMARMAKKMDDSQTQDLVAQLIERDFTAAGQPEQMEERQKKTFFAVYYDLKDRDPPRHGYFNGQPWMFLNASPEVLRFVDEHVREDSVERIEAFTSRYPMWWIAQSPYFTRWTGDESVGLATPQSIGMIFPMHRWVLKTDPAELRMFLRSSPTGIGDCHWMEAAVSAIEAAGETTWQGVAAAPPTVAEGGDTQQAAPASSGEPAPTAELKFGVGQGVGDKDLHSPEAQKLVEQAIDEALAQYGPGKPKLLLFFENIRKTEAVRQGFKRAGDIPVVGVDMGGYAPLGVEAFPHHKETRSIMVWAIGGDVDIQTAGVDGVEMPIKDWEFKKQKNPDGTPWSEEQVQQARAASIERHKAWGRQLAEQFEILEGKTHLFLQLGTQHTPRMTWLTEGIEEVFPQDVRYVGIAASDYGAVWENAKTKKPHSMLGVMLSGDFEVAIVGSPGEVDDQAVDQAKVWPAKIDEAMKEIGGRPDTALIFGCAGWHNDLENKCTITREKFEGIPLMGSFGGGEIGHYTTDGPAVSKPGHMFIALIKGKD